MKCRQCGTEIAEKALICYKCGTATTEAKFQPVRIGPRRSPVALVILVVLALLAVIGVYVAETGATETTRLIGWGTAALAVVLLAVRLMTGRSRTR